MKILITGGNSAVALKLLKAFNNSEVVLADYGEVPLFATKDYRFISLGIKNEDVLAHTLLNNCLNEGVEAILPLYGFEVEALAKAKILFSEFNIDVLLPDSLAEMYLDTNLKEKTNNWTIFKDGVLIFSTINEESINKLANIKHLSGAFYITTDNKLKLITI